MKSKIALAPLAGVVLMAGFLAIALSGCSGPPIGSDQWRKNIFASAPDAPQPASVAVRP